MSSSPAAGDWLHNPVTGELARVDLPTTATDGRRVEVTLWLQPGAAVAGEHVHDALTERFEVREGEVAFLLDGARQRAVPGDAAVEIPPGTRHDWWNAGAGVAQVRVAVEAAAPGAVERFSGVIEVLWSLGALGRVNDKGLPDPLWLAAIAREYRDVIRFTRPPAAVQTALFGPLAAIARRTGRDPLAPELHGSGAPCAIPAPDGERLRDLLAHRAATRRHAAMR